jgi:hypothetical protein
MVWKSGMNDRRWQIVREVTSRDVMASVNSLRLYRQNMTNKFNMEIDGVLIWEVYLGAVRVDV